MPRTHQKPGFCHLMPSVETDDVRYMARALQLAELGLYSTDPNPRVGALVVREGRIVGEGWHRCAGEPHAEVHALRQAGVSAQGATVYVTLEPCAHQGRTPPCCDALVEAGVARVVAAVRDPSPKVAGQGLARLEAAGIQTACGVLEEQAKALNPGFFQLHETGRPWVRLKLAASLDGRTAMASGESQWITGPAARADVQRLRARSSAILTGIGTVLADDPALTVRVPEMGPLGSLAAPVHQPLRVVVDSGLRLDPTARIVQQPGPLAVLTSEQALRSSPARAGQLEEAGVTLAALASAGRPDWKAILAWLGARECQELLIEAGPTLAGSALAASVVDELWLYQAPTLLGDRARPLAVLGLDRMAEQRRWRVRDQRQLGPDRRFIFVPEAENYGTGQH